MPGAVSRWNAGKDLSWVPLRAERVIEVEYDQLQSGRFRRVARFIRWRPDKDPKDCCYDQLEAVVPYEFLQVFTPGG
jgi:ATP-dependent DNA ligase